MEKVTKLFAAVGVITVMWLAGIGLMVVYTSTRNAEALAPIAAIIDSDIAPKHTRR